MLGGAERGTGRLRICERTKLLLVEIDTVACCSPAAGMAAGCRPVPPWTYRRIAGEYTYLEKRFVAELAPPWPLAPPRRLQDFATPPPPGREARPRVPPTRCPPGQPEGTGGSRPWGLHPPCAPRPLLLGGRLGPPSYEAHMQRVQAAHVRHGGPPPYISPPAYDAPHRTLQLRPPRAPHSPVPAPRGRGAVPVSWSHTLPRVATEARHRRSRGMQSSPGGPSTPRHSQTLPRAAAGQERVLGCSRGRRGMGGHVLIDATRVVVRAQYIPPPQLQQVRYARGSPGPTAPLGSSPAPPRAATPPTAPLPPREPPDSPCSPWRSPAGCRGPRGRLPPRRPTLYAQALREAVSRIRRHTAPDSDSEAEGGAEGSCRWLCRDARAYSSSSSSLESTGAPPGTASPPWA
ncbi:dendrin [Chlamydotis macqueenii]